MAAVFFSPNSEKISRGWLSGGEISRGKAPPAIVSRHLLVRAKVTHHLLPLAVRTTASRHHAEVAAKESFARLLARNAAAKYCGGAKDCLAAQ